MKQFYESKTFWLNLVVTLLAIYDQLAPFIPKEWLPKAAAVVGILNILLRVFSTSKQIKLSANDTGG
jgi:hypothetical protein